MKQKIIDLHSHTTASDGSLTPNELIKLACEKGLTAIAITDHDTVDGLEEAYNCIKEGNDIELIAGVEVSADHHGEIHILGYFVNYKDDAFKDSLNELKKIRDMRNECLIEKFKEHNIEIKYECKDLVI